MNVASADEGAAQKAIAMIQELTATPELDKSYLGRVERITDFGAFIEIMPGVDGLLHVSEIANYRVKDVRDELKEGEQIMVKVINIDPSGKVRLSRKALLGPDEGTAPRDPRPVHDGPVGGRRPSGSRRPGSRRQGPRRPSAAEALRRFSHGAGPHAPHSERSGLATASLLRGSSFWSSARAVLEHFVRVLVRPPAR